jgi:hypothetical protein
LELFVLNENDVYSYGDAENEYVKIASKHNLIFNEKHEIQHRNIARARRPASWRTNRTSRITNTIENNITNNNESTIINQFDDESNDSSSENASQSESLQSFSDMSDNLEELPFLPSEDNSSI